VNSINYTSSLVQLEVLLLLEASFHRFLLGYLEGLVVAHFLNRLKKLRAR
jgi:hypothetical protein